MGSPRVRVFPWTPRPSAKKKTVILTPPIPNQLRTSKAHPCPHPPSALSLHPLPPKGLTMHRRLIPLFFTLSLCLLSTAVRAQQLTQADKDKAIQYLESTKKDVLDATSGLSPAQWNFKPAPDRWSIAECMEHIAAAEDYIRGIIIEKVMVAPAAPGRDVVAIDAAIIENVPARKPKPRHPKRSSPPTASVLRKAPSTTSSKAAPKPKPSSKTLPVFAITPPTVPAAPSGTPTNGSC